ncbi:class I SAM-dependent methyltransferase [Microbacterium sp.]|uniref:class I SAM-dependent methyltransferase n=1 Tax=Microbacterium sp. TaxID=51671 RepID=UPI003A84253E
MGWWSERVLPRAVSRVLDRPDIAGLRRLTAAPLHGRVLELGFGSGLNVPHLPESVTGIGAVEPSDHAWWLSRHRRAQTSVAVERIGLDGASVSAADASYDGALVTFTLCTIPDVARALDEVRRVVAPGGTLAFLEHGLSPDSGVARWQHRLDPLQQRFAGGCHLTRDTAALVRDAGFTVTGVDAAYLRVPAVAHPVAYLTRGHAHT